MRGLKRHASHSDDESAPVNHCLPFIERALTSTRHNCHTPQVKRSRANIENTHVRRLAPLRRSDTQTLDVNASTPVLQHLPPNIEPVAVPSTCLSKHRGQEQDAGGSTDEESQDEEGAWDRRAKAHRQAALSGHPRGPVLKSKARMPKTADEIALLEGSDSEDEVKTALRTRRAAAGKFVAGSKTGGTFAVPKLPAKVMGNSSIASASSTTTTTITTRSVSRASSSMTVMTTTTVAQRVQAIDKLTVSCPTRAPRAQAPRPMPAPRTALPRPQRLSSQARQNAINAIAGWSLSSAAASLPAAQRPATAAPLASQPSAILRRSRRIQSKLSTTEGQ
ncbi:hypothetical protein FRC12_006789 [Ceratobasidium sp. 428]|nr:hypothetical protein FRC12_006789 [Ceratobasidium sp. 428]